MFNKEHIRYALIFGLLTGLWFTLLLASPVGHYLEEDFGLAILFKMRGKLVAPADVVIVNIGDDSAVRLNLSGDFEDWPRDVYADLVEKLHQLGAAVIVFDIHFGKAKTPIGDHRFAEAMHKAGNVILYEKMIRRNSGVKVGSGTTSPVEIEKLIPPDPLFAEAALASAPFPIPKMPVRVNQAWTFKTSAGDLPTLPVVALQALAFDHAESFNSYLTAKIGENSRSSTPQISNKISLIESMRQLRQHLAAEPGSSSKNTSPDIHDTSLTPEDSQLLEALYNTYSGDNSIYINFYGPANTFETYSLYDLLSPDDDAGTSLHDAINGKTVFIGAAKTTWAEQNDGFYTVFTQPDGLDLSGVEIAATVFANLYHHLQLKQLQAGRSNLIIICSALLCCIITFLLNPLVSVAVIILIIGMFLAITHTVFAQGIWLPIITWTLLVPITSLALAIVFRFVSVRRQRTHITQALKLYLPGNVVDEISRDLSFVDTGDQMIHGVCLSTDAQNYTTLSEHLTPVELSALMKDYFELMFNSVKRYDGVVCNVIGDAMFSLWPSTNEQPAVKRKACRAAIDILESIDMFNEDRPDLALPTRIGLHCGYLLMGHIGAKGHYEYAPVGDIVNTASRIENLNKKLGTWILASEETVKDCQNISTRLMGTFLMSGKNRPVTLYQVLPNSHITSGHRLLHDEAFPEALEIFRTRKWEKAENAFSRCLELQAEDGPSKFYRQLSASYRVTPPDEQWNGVIPLQK